MKKHKVEIPEGYEIENTTTTAPPISITINLKPIKKELPKTWEEYKCNDRQILETEPFDIVIPQKYTHPFHALIKLIQLRDHYNDGWKPDWTTHEYKCIIWIDRTIISTTSTTNGSRVLSFKTTELRDKFLSNFRDLIETAKPLL